MMNELKFVSKALLLLPVEMDESVSIFVTHPYFENAICYDGKELVNILEDPDALERCVQQYMKVIDRCKTPLELMLLLRPQYAMTWLKYTKEYMPNDIFSELLSEAWINCENSNMDVNVPINESVEWFRNADKKHLMEPEEYEVYQAIPETITLYRGVSKGRNEKGMSWTNRRDKAEWFANRFGKGYLLQMTAKKSDILAYFSRRDEYEYLVYPTKYKVI